MISILSLFFGCASNPFIQKNSIKVGYKDISFTELGETGEPTELRDGKILIKPFEIDLELSDKAIRTLKANGETIVFAFHFYGDPGTPQYETNKKYFSDCYGFSIRQEYSVRRRYKIQGLEIPSDFYAPLANKDISVNLNIISGRKSTKNNFRNW